MLGAIVNEAGLSKYEGWL